MFAMFKTHRCHCNKQNGALYIKDLGFFKSPLKRFVLTWTLMGMMWLKSPRAAGHVGIGSPNYVSVFWVAKIL